MCSIHFYMGMTQIISTKLKLWILLWFGWKLYRNKWIINHSWIYAFIQRWVAKSLWGGFVLLLVRHWCRVRGRWNPTLDVLVFCWRKPPFLVEKEEPWVYITPCRARRVGAAGRATFGPRFANLPRWQASRARRASMSELFGHARQ
jgi:hypothetical protein